MSMRVRRYVSGLVAAVVVAGGAILAVPSAAQAADLSQFDPGSIIVDAVFFDANAMSQDAIQSFLQSKETNCAPSATCVKDYYTVTKSVPADAMCGTYSGGTSERASAIIYKVAQACGVNPRVLLVTMQKEQGLITSVWPSDYAYAHAMGADCPDTTGCNSISAGFFAQVYKSAWQLKRYANPPGTSNFFTWYAPGNTWNILYNPNTACGKKPVYVRNQATADLYYYTPYTPNQAALRAGYGSGDSCSAYGNRNFYNYFVDWFGSTGAMGLSTVTRWDAIGGAGGVLGNTIGVYVCGTVNGGCYQNFQNGAISWTSTTGAWETYGDIRARWQAVGFETGVLGYPVGSPTCGTRNGGCYQNFQRGAISWTSSTGAWETYGAIRAFWQGQGFETGYLGYPSGPVTTTPAASTQAFQGWAVITSASGTFASPMPVFARWQALGGGAGVLGSPTSAYTCGTANGGCYQNFQNGAISWTAATGAWETYGAIRSVWRSQGYETGPLGYPKSAVTSTSAGSTQTFQGGTVATSASGTFTLSGAIGARWQALGGAGGALGYPIGAQTCGTLNGGCYQEFQNGAVSWTSATGAWETYGAIRTYWKSKGYETGPLGYPTGAVTTTNSGTTQTFQGGTVASSTAGTFVVGGVAGARWGALGGATGVLGMPTGAYTCGTVNGGCYQDFANGAISWTSATGAWETYGDIRAFWRGAGYETGYMGYPTGPVATSATGLMQRFQGGTAMWDSTTKAVTFVR